MESQTKEILKHLKKGKTITALEALKLFGCLRLAARIVDIHAMGYDTARQMVNVKGRSNKVARYSLVGSK